MNPQGFVIKQVRQLQRTQWASTMDSEESLHNVKASGASWHVTDFFFKTNKDIIYDYKRSSPVNECISIFADENI